MRSGAFRFEPACFDFFLANPTPMFTTIARSVYPHIGNCSSNTRFNYRPLYDVIERFVVQRPSFFCLKLQAFAARIITSHQGNEHKIMFYLKPFHVCSFICQVS